MTIFGHDVSKFQSGVDVSRLGARFIIAKACQAAGGGYGTSRDSAYQQHKANARKGGKLFGAYIYLGNGLSAAANAALYASVEPDKSIPVMVDWEKGSGDTGFLKACVAELGKLGYRVFLTYAPQWYLNSVGGDLRGLPPIVSSKYPDMVARSVGDAWAARSSASWNSYGGNTTLISQFTSTGRDPAYPGTDLDCLAYNGSDSDLVALFGGEDDMANSDEILRIVTQINNDRGKTWDKTGNRTEGDAAATQALLFPYPVDTKAILARGGHSAGDLVNATHSTWETLHFTLLPMIQQQKAQIDLLNTAVAALANNKDLTPEALQQMLNEAASKISISVNVAQAPSAPQNPPATGTGTAPTTGGTTA